MDLLSNFFVKPVPDTGDDIVAFNFDFGVKALENKDVVTELADGDLLIEGWASDFEGNDREGENFIDDAFNRGIKSFLSGGSALCINHVPTKVLGKVLDLNEVEGKGLWMKARVDGAIRKHPELATYYEQIKNGTLKSLSVGGFFHRKLTAAGRKICDVDLTEISVTGVPIHSRPSFAVVAGKALVDFDGPQPVTEPSQTDNPGVDEIDLSHASTALDELAGEYKAFLARRAEGKAAKGDEQDLYFLALILKLQQMVNGSMATSDETEGELGEGGGPSDKRVDALVAKAKGGIEEWAKEAHKLAAVLGPLPSISYS